VPFDLSQFHPALLAGAAAVALLVVGVIGALLQAAMEIFLAVVVFAVRGLFFLGFWAFVALLAWRSLQQG